MSLLLNVIPVCSTASWTPPCGYQVRISALIWPTENAWFISSSTWLSVSVNSLSQNSTVVYFSWSSYKMRNYPKVFMLSFSWYLIINTFCLLHGWRSKSLPTHYHDVLSKPLWKLLNWPCSFQSCSPSRFSTHGSKTIILNISCHFA